MAKKIHPLLVIIVLVGAFLLITDTDTESTIGESNIVIEEESVAIIIESEEMMVEQNNQQLQALFLCEDSDGGKEYFIKGTVNSAFNTDFTDYCVNTEQVKEYFCSLIGDVVSMVGSANGYHCRGGRLTPDCRDTDGGRDYYTKGTVTAPSGNTYTDYCVNTEQVKEYWCDGNSVISLKHSENGYECASGELVSEGSCDSHDTSKCYSGDVYWYDSCNTREDKKEDCGTGEECSGGNCVDICVPAHGQNTCGTDNCGDSYDSCSSGYTCSNDQWQCLYESGGNGGVANVIVVSENVENKVTHFVATIVVENTGTATADDFLIEIQPKTSLLQSIITSQSTCDSTTPQNVHREIKDLRAGEQATVVLTTPQLATDIYYIHTVSTDQCCPGASCSPVDPYNFEYKLIGSGQITSSTQNVCENSICEGNEATTCPQDCPNTFCADGACNGQETQDTCPEDCGRPTPDTMTCPDTGEEKQFWEEIKNDKCQVASWLWIVGVIFAVLIVLTTLKKK